MIEGQARRSGVFLLELMISILFFCIAAAVGLQLFVKSHCISEDAGNMNMAVHKAAAAAEVFRSGTDMEDYLKEEYSYYEKEDNTFLVSFAADWENCKTKDAEYTLWITLGEAKQRMVVGIIAQFYAGCKHTVGILYTNRGRCGILFYPPAFAGYRAEPSTVHLQKARCPS